MTNKILRSERGITLVGGGAVDDGDLKLALGYAPDLIAVDSGAGVALANGYMPRAVVGDFDSISESDRTQIPKDRLFPITEQDTTDFHKALSRIVAPVILAVGFLGDRLDHQLAAFSSLVSCANQPCILIGRFELAMHLPSRFSVETEPGDIVSLFPILPVTGRSQGLEWPIDGLALAPDGRIGTSNRALGAVHIETDGAGLLAMFPRARLARVVDALSVRPVS